MDQFIDGAQKKKLFTSVWVFVILLSVFVAVLSLNALKENMHIGKGDSYQSSVVVTGKGEVVAIPDIALLSFSVVEEGKTVADAQTKATKKINDSTAALKVMGIDDKDIKTTNYSANPKYDYVSPRVCTSGYCGSTPVLSGYEVNQTISVKIRKTADAGNVLTKIGDLGVTNISGPNLTIDDMDTVQAQAREKAIEDAQAKAKLLAKSLGVSLGKIVSFDDSLMRPYYYEGAGMDSKMMNMSAGAPTGAPEIPVGENKVTSNVTITYEIK